MPVRTMPLQNLSSCPEITATIERADEHITLPWLARGPRMANTLHPRPAAVTRAVLSFNSW
ncbi:MAG: hypothetical protein WB559_06530, partial [Candidatus Acidiferrales bacterium]